MGLFEQPARCASSVDRRAGAHLAGCSKRPISALDRKSTRLNSSHSQISYAVFCLKKKKNNLDRIGRSHVLTPTTVKIRISYSCINQNETPEVSRISHAQLQHIMLNVILKARWYAT